MSVHSFEEIHASVVMEDLAKLLNSSAAAITEFSFADRGTSAFNKAIYMDQVNSDFLLELAAKSCNVSFLADCNLSTIDMHGGRVTPRHATNGSITRKSIISFDVDFKDMASRNSEESYRELAGSLTETLLKKNLPFWIISFSGHGLHLHFKLNRPFTPTSPKEYQDQYHQWLDMFSLIFGHEIVFDRSCSNLGRLMRLPFSTNWKDPKNPVKTQVLFHNPSADASEFFERLSTSISPKTCVKHANKLTLEKILSHFEYKKMASLSRTKDEIVCSSPFSTDVTPSFFWSPTKQVYYDFSTGRGGNVYQLISALSGEKNGKQVDAIIKKIMGTERSNTDQGRYSLRTDGLWFSKATEDEDENLWICSPLSVEAMTRDHENGTWGRVLTFSDQDQIHKTWAMPMDMLAGDGLELRKELLNRGLRISPNRKARHHLLEYLQSCSPNARLRCIERIGWQNDSFVLPTKVFNVNDLTETIVFQKEGDFASFRTQGTLKEWQERVAIPCRGNSRLIFALATAFAPPLLHLVGEESGGIHFVGPSSIGKTLALRIAASVWGGGGVNGFVRKWRSTVNGLESLAESRCDSLLVLDELAEIPAKDAAQATYMLANGCGKKRLDRNGSPRPSAEWRILFLSSGEMGLGQHLAEVGENHRGGQFVRLVDIEADAGRGLGIFDTLGEWADASFLAEHLRRNTAKFYGSPIHIFLEKLVKDPQRDQVINEIIQAFLSRNGSTKLSGQHIRVAKRFALIAAGGVLASDMGILPFAREEILNAVHTCFKNWTLRHSDHADFETATVLSKIRQYLQTNGCSQFPVWDGKTQHVFNGKCSGFRLQNEQGGIEWLVLNEVFRNEVCRGIDFRKATRALKSLDLIKTDAGGRSSIPMRLPHFGLTRVYHLNVGILEKAEF